MSLSRALVVLPLAVAAFAQADPDGDKLAKELLLKSMRRTLSINVVAIVERRGDEDGLMRKIKLEQSGGRQAMTVLAPLSISGVTFVDDGHKRFTFVPDEGTLFEERSVRPQLAEYERRLDIAERNYDLRLERSEPIAGRPTVRIVAVPKAPGLPQRLFVIDEETAFLLRMAAVRPGGEREVYVNTKVVTYPKSLPSGRFEKEPLGAARTVRRETPDSDCQASDLPKALGFAPRMPAKLPFGFSVSGSEVRKSVEGRALAMKLTDGLASAVIYQFRCQDAGEGIQHLGNRSMLREGSIAVALVSDLPVKARQAILEAFVKDKAKLAAAERSLSKTTSGTPAPPAELFKPKPVFGSEERRAEAASLPIAVDADPDPVPVAGSDLGPPRSKDS